MKVKFFPEEEQKKPKSVCADLGFYLGLGFMKCEFPILVGAIQKVKNLTGKMGLEQIGVFLNVDKFKFLFQNQIKQII